MSDNSNALKNDFEDIFEKSLKSLGYIFPTKDDEVESFEASNKIIKTPDSYDNAKDLLKMSKLDSICKKTNPLNNKSAENLARAARKGNEIPDDILKRMKADRRKTDNEEQV